MRKNYRNLNIFKIKAELESANIDVVFFESDADARNPVAKDAYITFADGTDMALVQQIIDAHDPTPIPPTPTKEEILEQQVSVNTDYLLDVDFRLMLMEFDMI